MYYQSYSQPYLVHPYSLSLPFKEKKISTLGLNVSNERKCRVTGLVQCTDFDPCFLRPPHQKTPRRCTSSSFESTSFSPLIYNLQPKTTEVVFSVSFKGKYVGLLHGWTTFQYLTILPYCKSVSHSCSLSRVTLHLKP